MNEARKKKTASVVSRRQSGIVVVLEDIHDPHNAAAILRTCDALGIQNVYFIFEKETRYNPKRIGKTTSSSANKWLDFTLYTSTRECLNALKKEGYTLFVTAITDSAVKLMNAIFSKKKIAVVIGNEHRGVSETAIKLADQVVMIPMVGFVQSFNVSVATAIVLWEIIRQKKGKERLGKSKQAILLKNLLKRAET